MYKTDNEYSQLLELVLSKGRVKENRTGINTIGVFGAQARFDLSEGFPILSTKKIAFKSVVHELLWFLSGSTNIKYLVDNDVRIWDANCFALYQKLKPRKGGIMIFDELLLTNQEREAVNSTTTDELTLKVRESANRKQHLFTQRIKDDPEFAAEWGDLGEGTYGGMWRAFPFIEDINPDSNSAGVYEGTLGHVDQIQKVIDKLKSNPDDRRLIVSAWHPYWVDHCALPPCHCLFQFHTEKLTSEERALIAYEKYRYEIAQDISFSDYIKKLYGEGVENYDNCVGDIPERRLNLQLYQRSCDLFLGVPFNISSYSLLLAIVAHVSGMVAGEFVHTFGDLHIYENHIEQVKTQLKRWPKKSPKLWLNENVKNLFDFKFEDVKLLDYDPHPAIKAEMAV